MKPYKDKEIQPVRQARFVVISSRMAIRLIVLFFCAVVTLITSFSAVYAQRSVLILRVKNIEDKPLAGIVLSVKGSNLATKPTDQGGRTRLELPARTLPGETVCLGTAAGSQNLVLIAPLDGCVSVPSRANSSQVIVILGQRGDPRTLKHEFERVTDEFVDSTVALGQAFYEQAKYQESVKSFREALTVRPNDPKALSGLALALTKIGDYREAEATYRRALEIKEKELGQHPEVAGILNGLGQLYYEQGRYDEAQLVLQRALMINRKSPAPNLSNLATTLNSLGVLYSQNGNFQEALAMYQSALEIQGGPKSGSSDVAFIFTNLANLYHSIGRMSEARVFYQRALVIFEKTLGPEHPEVGLLLENLAVLYSESAEYLKADKLLNQALAIKEKALGPNNLKVAYTLNNIAVLYLKQNNYVKAEPYLLRSLTIRESALGSNDPDVAYSIGILGDLYYMKGDYARAEPLYQRALLIIESSFGAKNPTLATMMKRLARLYVSKGDYSVAEGLYQRALKIEEDVLGSNSPVFAGTLDDYALLLSKLNRFDEALGLKARARLIRSKTENGEPFEVRINEPDRDGVRVPRIMNMKGTALVPSGYHLWVLAHRNDFKDLWWPQGEGTIEPGTGQWQVPVALGTDSDVGEDFEISVIIVDEAAHKVLQGYRNEAIRSGVWNPIKAPLSAAAPQIRRVVRVQ